MDDLPEGNKPDWDRYLVKSDGNVAPVGDPTRWGAMVNTPLVAPAVGTSESQSPQILAIATRDPYARNWAVLGNLTLPRITWRTPAGVGTAFCRLELVMGVGQIQMTQAIVLADCAAQVGLCYQQFIDNGGPYDDINVIPTTSGDPAGALYDETRSFAIIGGLVGQSINIRAQYVVSNPNPPSRGLPCTARLELIVTPFAAGKGL